MSDNTQKYVRLKEYDQIIVFPKVIEHSTFKFLKPISAGFCDINDGVVNCYGDSFSLELESDKQDTFFATRQIFGWNAAEQFL